LHFYVPRLSQQYRCPATFCIHTDFHIQVTCAERLDKAGLGFDEMWVFRRFGEDGNGYTVAPDLADETAEFGNSGADAERLD
jgi:hypothetical protein